MRWKSFAIKCVRCQSSAGKRTQIRQAVRIARQQLFELRTRKCPTGVTRVQLLENHRVKFWRAAPRWHFNPPAAAAERLIALILEAFKAAGGNFDAGRGLPALLRSRGLEPQLQAEVYALPLGHPYLRPPLQFAKSLEPRLLKLVSADELNSLRTVAEAELSDSARWRTTFTLIQAWARLPA